MSIDLPNIEYNTPVPEVKKESDTVSYEVRKDLDMLQNQISKTDSNEHKELADDVRIGNKIDKLSSVGTNTYELYIGSKRVGSLVKCEAQTGWVDKAMFISAETAPKLFDTDTEGNSFPNIEKIKQYFTDRGAEEGKQRVITMISTGPTFSSYGNTKLAGVNYDNGVAVGTEQTIDGSTTSGKGIISISGGKIQISHTQEMDQAALDALIAKKADIMTMSSMKRNGNINPNNTLWNHPYGHSLVQFDNGTRGELILNNCTTEEKKKVVNALNITRAVYADADAKSNYLDGIRIQTDTGLRYSHPDQGDLFMNENTQSGQVERDNMPGIIVHYAVQE